MKIQISILIILIIIIFSSSCPVSAQLLNSIPSPLNQYKSGISPNETMCLSSFALALKAEDGSPACVNPDHESEFLKRGWAKVIIDNSADPRSAHIKLYLSTNSTSIMSGKSIRIDISLNSTVNNTIDIHMQKQIWSINSLSAGSCSNNLALGIVIMGGYFDEKNFTTGKRLVLSNQESLCSKNRSSNEYYVFQPLSNIVTISECDILQSQCPSETSEMKNHFILNGFWKGQQFQLFNMGTYTIVVGDQWGHYDIQHFVVTNSTKG